MNTRLTVAFSYMSFVWGSTYLFIKIGLIFWPPFLLASLRNLIACVVMMFVLLATNKKIPITWRGWWPPVLFAVFNGGAFALIFWGERYIPSGQTAVLIGSMPIFSVFLARFWNKEQVKGRQYVAVVLGVLGLLLATTIHHGNGFSGPLHLQIIAKAAVVTAATFYAVSYMISKKYFQGDILTNTTIHLGASGLYLLLLSLATGERVILNHVSLLGWGSLIYLAIPGSALAYWIMFYMVRNLSSVTASYVTLINPVVAVFLGVIFLHEAWTWNLILGTLLILSGAWMVENIRFTKIHSHKEGKDRHGLSN